MLLEPGNQIVLSVASIWEVVIKHALKKLRLPTPVEEYVATRAEGLGFELLPIATAHVLEIGTFIGTHSIVCSSRRPA